MQNLKIRFIISALCLCFSLQLIASEVEPYRLYVFECGKINVPRYGFTAKKRHFFKFLEEPLDHLVGLSPRPSGREALWQSIDLTNICLLAQKGDVEVLWDTGVPDSYIEYPDGVYKYSKNFLGPLS